MSFHVSRENFFYFFFGSGEGGGVLSDAAGDAFAGDDPTDICEKDGYKNTETNIHKIKS